MPTQRDSVRRRAHKIALDPTNVQATYLAKACGAARFAYNWALATWKDVYQANLVDPALPKANQYQLRKELNTSRAPSSPG